MYYYALCNYVLQVVSNSNGELSTNYPSSLVVLVGDKHSGENGETAASNGSLPLSLSASVLGGTATTNGSSGQADTNSVASNSTPCMTASSIVDGFNPVHELPKIKDLCSKARYARCRARFPVPVILYNNKHICR